MLDCRLFKEKHTGENLSKILEEILQEFEILDKT